MGGARSVLGGVWGRYERNGSGLRGSGGVRWGLRGAEVEQRGFWGGSRLSSRGGGEEVEGVLRGFVRGKGG